MLTSSEKSWLSAEERIKAKNNNRRPSRYYNVGERHMEKKTLSKTRKKSENNNETWKLRLYVAGHTPNSIAAFDNLKKICEEHLEIL